MNKKTVDDFNINNSVNDKHQISGKEYIKTHSMSTTKKHQNDFTSPEEEKLYKEKFLENFMINSASPMKQSTAILY